MEKLIFFLVLAVVSLIQNALKRAEENRKIAGENRLPPEQPSRQSRPEIDEFLTGSSTRTQESQRVFQAENPEPRRLKQTPFSDRGAENDAPQRPQQQKPRQKSRNSQSGKRRNESSRGRQTAPAAAAGSGDTKAAKKNSGQVGSGVRDHVDQYLARRPEVHRHAIEDHVKSDMAGGIRSAPLSETDTEAVPVATVKHASAETIFQALRNPDDIRQAILVNEILARPRIFRR
jgi:hypothetical protein